MPVVPRKEPEKVENTPQEPPDQLRAYRFHGVSLAERGTHGVGDCPFCGRDGKFSVDRDTGLGRCFVCGSGSDAGGMNPLGFLRLLHERSVVATTKDALAVLAADRGFSDPATVSAWGVCQSVVDRTWLVPGYGADGKLTQLYRRTRTLDNGKWAWKLLPTPGVWPDGKVHALHGEVGNAESVLIFEGTWDAMAYWETAQTVKDVGGRYERTGSAEASVLAGVSVVAVPGCNVFRDDWAALFRGKDVMLMFDSDHPRVMNGKTFRAGFDGMYRIAKKLSGIARSVRWLRWGRDGFDPERPSGYDVRDHLVQSPDRVQALAELLAKVEVAPADWFSPSMNGKHINHVVALRPEVEPTQCRTWAACEAAWKDAQEWRQVAADVMCVMLAVATSTLQGGNQLFLQVIGSPSSGKTALCEGLLVSSHCHALEHLTGFHSGYKKPGSPDADCSLIARINGKTLVTCEGDVIMASPRFDEIMSQQRRIFDGTSGATYKNTDEDTLHQGLRTPWIMAGTPALLDKDQARLGDRFMRIIMEDPDDGMKRKISRRAFMNEMDAMMETSNGTAGSILNPKLRKAYALTGGYVDWLRANVETLLPTTTVPEDIMEKCIDLAELAADLRARPNYDARKQEQHDSKEMPYRLAAQFGRMARCLAIVKNSPVDGESLRVVRKVALDTAAGMSLNIARWMCSTNPKSGLPYQHHGLMIHSLSAWGGVGEDKLASYLTFLRKIKVVEYVPGTRDASYRLTDRVFELYLKVMGE